MAEASNFRFAEINTNGIPLRFRRRHAKTRTGCLNCKKRKVKCDENYPRCGGCMRRNLECNLANSATSPSAHSGSSGASYGSEQKNLDIPKSLDLSSIRLFHHFEHVCVTTLALPLDLFRTLVIPLSFEHDFLMHAVLMMSAAHLYFLDQDNESLLQLELHHATGALTGIRNLLPNNLTSKNADAVFAASILLYHHSWCIKPGEPEHDLGIVDLIPLATGIKNVYEETRDKRSELWNTITHYSPRVRLELCASYTVYPRELEASFRRQYAALDSHYEGDADFDAYLAEFRRLVPTLSVMKLGRSGVDISSLYPEVRRFLFTWPALISEEVMRLVPLRDDALVILMQRFFEAVDELLGPDCWWKDMRTKAVLMSLSTRLEKMGIETQSA